MTLEEFLQSREPFSSLTEEERRELARSCVRKTLSDRERLFQQGEPSDLVYLVTEGVVRLDISHPNGSLFMLVPLKAGMMTDGELSDGAPHPVTATAMKQAVVYMAPRRTIKALMCRNPGFMESFLRVRDASMRYILRLFSTVVSLDPETRLAKLLLTFHKIFGEQDDDRLGYDFSQEAMADMIACSRQSTAKIIKSWKEQGLVSMKYKSVQLLDIDRLCEIAQWNPARWRSGEGRQDSWFSRLR